MKVLQGKSDCCKAKVIRYGAKRRQCVSCKKTWSIRKKKRGRKEKRLNKKYIDKVFGNNMFVKHLERSSHLSTKNIYKRFDTLLKDFVSQKRIIRVRGDKLIFIIDAQWRYFKNSESGKKELWTLYSIIVKPIHAEHGTILDPLLIKGKESATKWIEIFNHKVPHGLKNRASVLVSDSLRGIERLAQENNLIHQRCNFHILQELHKRVGKRKSTKGRNTRKMIYDLIDKSLKTTSQKNFKELRSLSERKDCPPSMRMIVREFLRRHDSFRAYLYFPELNIPRTSSVVESLHSLYKSKSAKIKTPEAWHRWCLAIARSKEKMKVKSSDF